MKKSLVIFLILFLALFFTNTSFASDSASQSASVNVTYDLPYPGILPDNPLYFLKAVRDNLLGLFITDSLKRGEYNLLQSDKRLAAAGKLLDKGKADLSITALSKSGNYFYNAIDNGLSAKSQGENFKSFLEKLVLSSKKHQEIIEQMINKTTGKNKQAYKDLLKNMMQFENKAQQANIN